MEINLASISWIFAAVVGGLALCFLAASVPIRAYAKERDLEVLIMRMKTAARLTYPSATSFHVSTERVKASDEPRNRDNTDAVHGKDGSDQNRKKLWVARLVGKNAAGNEIILRDTEGRFRAKRADALYELHNLVAIGLAKSNEQKKHEFDMVTQGSRGVDATNYV